MTLLEAVKFTAMKTKSVAGLFLRLLGAIESIEPKFENSTKIPNPKNHINSIHVLASGVIKNNSPCGL